MSNDLADFEAFMQRRTNAAQAYINGDAAPVSALAARVLPATFYSPKGGHQCGAKEVTSTYENDAHAFAPGSEGKIEILHLAASNGVAYWVGFQHAQVRMRGGAESVPFHLRVTEIFRREAGEWKLVHRHADPLITESAKPPKTEEAHAHKSSARAQEMMKDR